MVVMEPLTHTGADSSPVGAVIRVIVAFVVFFATLAAIGLVLARVPTPDVLVNLPDQIATLCGVAAVVFISTRVFDISPTAYGLKMNRRWISDLLGGTAIGVLFQAVTTAVIVGTGTGTIVDRWSMGSSTALRRLSLRSGRQSSRSLYRFRRENPRL